MEMHDVFHVSLLRPYKTNEKKPPPALLPTGETEYEVETVLDHEDDADNERFYKVKWIGYAIPTWEPEVYLQNSKHLIADYFHRSGKNQSKPKQLSKRGVAKQS